MKRALLDHAPTEDELARLYRELARHGAKSVGAHRPWPYVYRGREQLFVLASQMMRYDARLLSILVQWFRATYEGLNPLFLRKELRTARWPQSLLVALEFAKHAAGDQELVAFVDYVGTGFSRVEPAERFFIDTERPGSKGAARNLGRNLAQYARWGYVGQEKPIVDPQTKRTVGRYDAATRRRILRDFAERHDSFSLAEYLSAVDHGISRQQARLDLNADENIEAAGHGRGAHWRSRR